MLLAFGAADPDQLDVFAVADALWRRGWYVDRQQSAALAALHRQRDARRADPGVPRRPDAAIDDVATAGARRATGCLRHRGVTPSQGPCAPDR